MKVLETVMMISGFRFSRLQDKQDSFVGKSKAKKSHTVKRERSLFCNSYAESEVLNLRVLKNIKTVSDTFKQGPNPAHTEGSQSHARFSAVILDSNTLII